MPLWAHLSSSCYSSPFVLIVFRVLVRTEVFVWRWFPRLCFCDRPTKAYEITVSSCCTYQCFVCNPTSGNTCKRLTQTEFRGGLCGCGRGGVGQAVTYLWNNPQSFKLNLLFISCSSYLSEHRRTVDVFMDLPLIRVWLLASGDWLVCMSAVGASVHLGQSAEINSSGLNCSNWKSGFTQRHRQQDGLQQLQQEQNPQRPGAHAPNRMWVFPALKHLKQVWGKLERREQTSLG